MRLRALAKINLGLDIIGKRPDGYHDVKMIMQTITMYDRIELNEKKSKGISLRTNLPYIPTDRRNLVWQAADMILQDFKIDSGVHIDLQKFIPVAAGMAGGSSDAAAVLVGMNHLFKLGLSKKELMEYGVKIGADVPYCIMRGTALAEGIGEKLTRLPAMPSCYILVGKPGISVSTKLAYESLQLDAIGKHPDIDGIVEDIKAKDLYAISKKIENVFEPGIIAKYPVIQEIKDKMIEAGALNAMMSGSGPTVFGVFEDLKTAGKAAEKLKETGLCATVFLAKTFN